MAGKRTAIVGVGMTKQSAVRSDVNGVELIEEVTVAAPATGFGGCRWPDVIILGRHLLPS